MATYTINPNSTRIARYKINTGTMPTNNVIFSELQSDLAKNGTTITITNGEQDLFQGGMIATIEQLTEDGKKATAREVVLISGINGNTITITRGYEKCVVNDMVSPKVMDNTPLAFTKGARISVYVSRALLNGVQTRLKQVNCPCNTKVYNEEMALTNCIASNCDDWRDKLYQAKAKKVYNDCGFGDGSDGDCVITEDAFLDANCDYNFKNLTICPGALVRFMGAGTPRINVQRKFCNMGTIDLRGGTFVGACSKKDCITGCTVSNNACKVCYDSMCYGCGGAGGGGYGSGVAGSNATSSGGGDGGKGGCGYNYIAYSQRADITCPEGADGCPANGYNGGNGGNGAYGSGDSYCGYSGIGYDGGGGGGGGGYLTGNGGDGGNAGGVGYRGCYRGSGGNGGNGGIWGKGGKGGNGGTAGSNCNQWYGSGVGGNGGNGYIGGDGGANPYSNRHGSGNAGNGGKGVVCGGNGADRVQYDYMINGCSKAGNGGEAINNMYGLIIHACEYYNCCIMAQGGNGGNGGNAPSGMWSSSSGSGNTGGCGGCGACGANGGHVSIAYIKLLQQGSINTNGGIGGLGGTNNCDTSDNRGCRSACGANGAAGRSKVLKPF